MSGKERPVRAAYRPTGKSIFRRFESFMAYKIQVVCVLRAAAAFTE